MNLFNSKDKLFQDALDGEISLEELTPSDRAEAECFMRLRQDLRALRDVPEHQMSNERLRDAILSTGLNKKNSPSSGIWNALWIPTAACAFVVAFVGMNQYFKNQRTPVIHSGNLGESTIARNTPLLKFDSIAPYAEKVNAFSDKPINFGPVQEAAVAKSNVARAPRVEPHPAVLSTKIESDGGVDFDPAKFVAFVNRNQFDEVLGPSPVTAEPGPIVMIDSTPGVTTMNPEATEAGSISNVVVGG